MDHYKIMHEKKQSALQSIYRLEQLAVGASPEEHSIIDKLLIVARNNIEIAEIEYSCQLIIENARDKAA